MDEGTLDVEGILDLATGMEPDLRRLLRLETWSPDGGGKAHLLVASTGGDALVHALAVSPADGRLTCGSHVFDARALASCRDALLGLVTLVPATLASLDVLGVHEKAPRRLTSQVKAAFEALPHMPMLGGVGHLAASDDLWPDERLGHNRGRTRHGRLAAGYTPWTQGLPADAPPPAPGPGPDVRDVDAVAAARGWPGEGMLHGLLAPWHAAVRETCLPGPLGGMNPDAWTQATFRFLSARGEAGVRRRQAAQVQPAFLPTIAIDPALAALVDRGEPFEPALRDVVAEAVSPGVPSGLTVAKLRRMRAIGRTPHVDGDDDFRGAINGVSALPVDALPTTPTGWHNFLGQGRKPVQWALALPDPAAFLRGMPADWDAAAWIGPVPGRPFQPPSNLIDEEFSDLGDMIRQCADGLVAACLPWVATDRTASWRAALPILLAGRTFAAASKLQRAWHRDLARFQALLDRDYGLSWAPLFAPYDARGGIEIRCLTDSAALRAEGADGLDGDGMAGLAHCVGGYARSCLAGDSHIASISLAVPGGRRRLSTVEFSFRSGRLAVRQHRGLRNAPPPPEAQAALSLLQVDAATGDVAFFPDVEGVPAPSGDLSVPRGRAEVAFEAWRPYLPRRYAHGGIAALVADHPRP